MDMEEQRLSVRNVTGAATAWAASPVGRLTRIEALVSLSCCILAVLVFLSSGRRASRSAAHRLAVWTALMLSYPAASYTIGLMQSASFRNELIVSWGCFLLLLLGCADGIASYTLNDFEQQARNILNQGLQLVYVFLLLLSYVGALPVSLKFLLLLLWALSAVKLVLRIRRSLLTGRDHVLNAGNKAIADYMSREHELSDVDYHAPTMTGYKYVVLGEEKVETQLDGHGGYQTIDPKTNTDIVTIDKVWEFQWPGCRLDGGGDRDLCLSFAMFKLLRRRLGGYPLHESNLNKTRDFVKLGFLVGDDQLQRCRRMFRVIEVELGFMFDLFYARYPSPQETLIPDTVVFAAVVATSLATLFSPELLDYRAGAGGGGDLANVAATTGFDIWLTRMIIVLFLILELRQYLALVFSNWHKVKILCRYVRDESWQKSRVVKVMLKLMCYLKVERWYWNNSVGQYDLLYAAYDQSSSCLSCSILGRCIGGFMARWCRTTGRKDLSDNVKRAIYSFLRSKLTRIQHGAECTLRDNGSVLHDFSLAISRAHESTVRSILVWHIATSICHYRFRRTLEEEEGQDMAENHEVATTLSSYCAYLMSSAPELLPDHSYDTELLFKAVQHRAQQCLEGCRSQDDICSKLSESVLKTGDGADDDYRTVLADGKKLADQIQESVSGTSVWRVLAQLWVEMLLSVAPSDNVAGHVQKLATGGELITHLWALLTHAGIVEKRLNPYRRQDV